MVFYLFVYGVSTVERSQIHHYINSCCDCSCSIDSISHNSNHSSLGVFRTMIEHNMVKKIQGCVQH